MIVVINEPSNDWGVAPCATCERPFTQILEMMSTFFNRPVFGCKSQGNQASSAERNVQLALTRNTSKQLTRRIRPCPNNQIEEALDGQSTTHGVFYLPQYFQFNDTSNTTSEDFVSI